MRWHARLDSAWADRSLPWIVAGIVFVVLGGLSLARHRSLDSGDGLAVYTQAAWLIGSNRTPFVTLTGFHLTHMNGSFVLYPLGYALRWLPVAPSLLLVQSAALSYAVVPLWRLARRVAMLRVGAALALVSAYGLYPAVHNLNLAGFDPLALAVPGLVAMGYRGFSGSRFRYAVALLWVLGCRADLALTVAAFGLLLIPSQRRKAGIATAVVGLLYAVVAAFVSVVGAGNGAAPVAGAYDRYGDGVGEVLLYLLTHPQTVLGSVAAERNFLWMAVLVLPLVFLPLLSLRHLAPAVPWFVLIAVGQIDDGDLRSTLSAPMIPFVFMAAAFGLRKVGRQQAERIAVPPRLSAALVTAALVGFAMWSTASPYAEPWGWGGRDQDDQARLAATATVDSDEAVAATPQVMVLLAERTSLVEFRPGEPVPADVEVIVIDRSDHAGAPRLQPPGFRADFELRGLTVLRRISVSGRNDGATDDG